MRLTSEFWVAAYLRRCNGEGAFAVLRRRGAPEAGAIFVRVDRLDGQTAVFGPAPQSEVGLEGERLFTRLHKEDWIEPAESEQRLQKQLVFDPDLWIVEVEDRAGRNFLPLID
ncbi:DUF1491 family protein [Beijerinckia indica]|uniref:DUF1491 family protein n=1 Tax=Beijerinckia indica subsp. indica (strain ATCC 9039 / DSM 1715 / NCIMB 8712) TaxID=395963 RepID=B2IC32_BEII9|nr:DUF1491 family protein [Beijerinckia indica]ACB95287.1 protein of unknown function DUF1491 [Beijerinckia indica subsp. indica ATCC 9039]